MDTSTTPSMFHKRLSSVCCVLIALTVAIPIVGCGKGEPEVCAACLPTVEAPVEVAPLAPVADAATTVIIDTSKGSIEVMLWADKAPGTVSNFLAYVDSDFYKGLIFHRVIKGFMIQGGGFDTNMQKKESGAPIKNEASKEALNARGTVAMARTSDIHSATAQFFINLVDNQFLDHRDTSAQGYGYCAFGEVTEGLDVMDAIGNVPTGQKGMHGNVPTESIVIQSIRRK